MMTKTLQAVQNSSIGGCKSSTSKLCRAAVVGYNARAGLGSNTSYITIKNSWGGECTSLARACTPLSCPHLHTAVAVQATRLIQLVLL